MTNGEITKRLMFPYMFNGCDGSKTFSCLDCGANMHSYYYGKIGMILVSHHASGRLDYLVLSNAEVDSMTRSEGGQIIGRWAGGLHQPLPLAMVELGYDTVITTSEEVMARV